METKLKDRWLEQIKDRREEKTYIKYKTNINIIYKYFMEKINVVDEIEMLKKIDNDFIEDYIKELRGEYMLATVNSYISTLQVFFDYITINKKILSSNPVDGVNQFRITEVNKKKKTIPTKEDIRKMLLACNIREKGARDFEFLSSRDRALISLLAVNGNRIEEILQANISMIEKIDGGYAVQQDHTKGKVSKRILIVGESAGYFRDYLNNRLEMNNKIKCDDNIFVSARGKKMATSDVNRRLNTITKKANVEKFSSHSFRNYVTSAHIKNGTNETLINIHLGWDGGMKERYGTRSNLLKNYDIVIGGIIKKFI